MGQVAGAIEDICWELFGGPCPVHDDLDAMKRCDRKILRCEEFVDEFRSALSDRDSQRAEATEPTDPEPEHHEGEHHDPGHHEPGHHDGEHHDGEHHEPGHHDGESSDGEHHEEPPAEHVTPDGQ